MPVFPTHGAVPAQRALPPANAADSPTSPPLLEEGRPNLLDRARRRWSDRDARRVEAAGARALHRLDQLGSSWHVVDWPRMELPGIGLLDLERGTRSERAGFLAIGPGGLFAVTVADHGRARVLIAGDVVQINGKRPAYVVEARRDAKRASKAISAAVGLSVPVTPVLTFVGSGMISVYGLPQGCLVTPHQDLGHLLAAGGNRISAETAEKLSVVARTPSTWQNAPYRSAADYRWYEEGRTTTDKRPNRR
ncbi:MAG TPA: hypothetical protein VFX60_05040 [Micromonospora sp.]|nr:hypothetical protein [Micromonospora sp.]